MQLLHLIVLLFVVVCTIDLGQGKPTQEEEDRVFCQKKVCPLETKVVEVDTVNDACICDGKSTHGMFEIVNGESSLTYLKGLHKKLKNDNDDIIYDRSVKSRLVVD